MDVTEINNMERDGLLSLWPEISSGPIPHRMSAAFLRQIIIFEVQARLHGGLAKSFRKRLSKVAATKSRTTTRKSLQTGSRLMREWNGVAHTVDVTAYGFEWQGQAYRSLSAIAREITGAHWSGPRFFGVGTSS